MLNGFEITCLYSFTPGEETNVKWSHNRREIPSNVVQVLTGVKDLRKEVNAIPRTLAENLAGEYTCTVVQTRNNAAYNDSAVLNIRSVKSPGGEVFEWSTTSHSIVISVVFYGDEVKECTWINTSGFVIENDTVYSTSRYYDATKYSNNCTLAIETPPKARNSDYYGVYRCSVYWRFDKDTRASSMDNIATVVEAYGKY